MGKTLGSPLELRVSGLSNTSWKTIHLYGLGFRVLGFGFGVLGFKVEGLGFRTIIPDDVCRVLCLAAEILESRIERCQQTPKWGPRGLLNDNGG